MRGPKLLLILAAVMIGMFVCYTSAQAQSKQTPQQKIEKSKVGQDMRDVKHNAPGTFDGSGKRPAPPVKVQTKTMPTVTPAPRNIAVPKRYQSLHTTPPPSPVVTHKAAPPAKSSSPSKSSSPAKSSTPTKK